MDKTAPSNCRADTGVPKKKRPIKSIHTGVLAPTKVTFMAVEVVKARYSMAL
jgi:hypothetical protein